MKWGIEMTEFTNKTKILADLWINYRDEEDFVDFCDYNDLGLPLAYLTDNGLATSTDLGNKYIEETFDLLLTALEIKEDTGFESLDDLFTLKGL
jgi:hypothetical protein